MCKNNFEFMKIGKRKLGVMIRNAEVQLTLDNVPIIKVIVKMKAVNCPKKL